MALRSDRGEIVICLRYQSAWLTVVLPTVLFLLVWWGIFVGVLALAHWNLPGWRGVVAFFLPIPVSLAISVFFHGRFRRLAERGRGVASLSGNTVSWSRRLGRRRVDLGGPYRARISAGRSGLGEASASITFYPECEIFHLRGVSRAEVLEVFPEPYFIDELSVTPEEGLWGFDLRADHPQHRMFFLALLDKLWQSRKNNSAFLTFEKFPWRRTPQPGFTYIKMIDMSESSSHEQHLIEELENQIIDGLHGALVRLTPDYHDGYVYDSVWSKVSGVPRHCCLMPLGYISAEVSLPQPDWTPFLVGHALKEALLTMAGGATSESGGYIPLSHRHYLRITGRDQKGSPLELLFAWYDPGDPEYEEAEFVLRFVQAARNLVRG